MVYQSRDTNLTLQILINYFGAREKPGLYLRSLIIISKIDIQIETLDYNLPVLELITAFYALLIQNQKNYLQFLELLEFLQTKPPQYITRLEQHIKLNSLIDEERQQTPVQSSTPALKIDYNILIMYDLDIFKAKLRTVLTNRKEGIFAFNIIKNWDIVKNDHVFKGYLIKRIEKELLAIHFEQKHYNGIERRCHPPIYIELPCYSETVEQTIEKNLKDLLETPDLDIILIVKYESLDRTRLDYTAQNFLKIVENSYSRYFKDRRYLIIIFASLYFRCSLENFSPLPVPNKFEIDPQNIEHCPLTTWFQDTFLRQDELEPQNQSLYVDRLRTIIHNHKGDLIQTYQSFPRIFSTHP